MTDTLYIVLHWWVWAGLALFGAAIGFAGTALLSSRKPHWPAGRRVLTAALFPPALIALGTALGIGLVLATATPGDWSDLAVPAIARIGAMAALVAGAAALVSALFAQRIAHS